MPRHQTFVVAAFLFTVACGTTASPGDGGDAGNNGDGGNLGDGGASLVAQRALAQEGLAIALSSTVLQSQLRIFFALFNVDPSCIALPGGGSQNAADAGDPLVLANPRTVTIYFDPSCSKPYIVANASIIQTRPDGGTQNDVSETADYYGPSGTKLGVLSLTETALLPDIGTGGTYSVYGLGRFTPESGTAAVQVGIECSLSGDGGPATTLPCSGGIAQDFPALSLAVGSVTPFSLAITADGGITFSGTNSSIVTGALGSLTLTAPTPDSLFVSGGSTFGHTTILGSESEFTLFPPTPTSWTVTDSAHDQQWQISVVDNTMRNLTATIMQVSSGRTLATGAIDQSGSGTITYSDGTTAAITSWTLAD
jgi:hypothetical protein